MFYSVSKLYYFYLLYINLQKKSRQGLMLPKRKFIKTLVYYYYCYWGMGEFTCKSDEVPVVPVLRNRNYRFGLTFGIQNFKLILPVIVSLSNLHLCWRMVFSSSQIKPRAAPRFVIFIRS